MVYFEKEVTVADTVRIKERLAHYVMNILHDDGLYRHLHCYWPDDPYGANNCSFQVLTAPGSVTIYGDWMSAHEWIRTCYSLQWAARTYADGQSYKRQRQIRR